MFGNSKSLPGPMVLLAYGSAGAALLCSYYMLRQMMEQGGVQVGGDVITRLWPFVVLGSSFTLARMAGHLWARRMMGAMILIASGFLYLESISVGTSYFSALHALELKQQAEIASATGSEATEQASRAASTAAASLAGNLEAMQGGRFFTRSNQTAEQMTELMQAQRELIETQRQAAREQSASAQSMTDDNKKSWALAAALSLSIAAIFPSLGLGFTSDAARAERLDANRLWDFTNDDPEPAPSGKSGGLHSIQGGRP